jgi:hypothetical protein
MSQAPEPTTEERKHYQKPEIIHELELETRAGSSLAPGLDPFDLSGEDS